MRNWVYLLIAKLATLASKIGTWKSKLVDLLIAELRRRSAAELKFCQFGNSRVGPRKSKIVNLLISVIHYAMVKVGARKPTLVNLLIS